MRTSNKKLLIINDIFFTINNNFSVSKKLNFLIIGEKPTKKKVDYAKQLKIKVIDQAEFLKMLNKTS